MIFKAYLNRYPILAYFVLTFAISWGSVLVIIGGPAAIPGTSEQTAALFPAVFLATIAGPSLASLLLIGMVDGRAGYRKLGARLRHWRVGVRWYAVALLTGPVTVLGTLLALSLGSSAFLPGFLRASDASTVTGTHGMPLGAVAGVAIIAGLLEELGWTGFAIPRLSRRFGFVATGLIVGVLWGAWHFVSNIWASGTSSGPIPLALFLSALLFSFLPPFRVLLVWVYVQTESLLIAVLMHASLVTFWLSFTPPGITGPSLVIWYLAWAALLWALVAAISVISRSKYRTNDGAGPPERYGQPRGRSVGQRVA